MDDWVYSSVYGGLSGKTELCSNREIELVYNLVDGVYLWDQGYYPRVGERPFSKRWPFLFFGSDYGQLLSRHQQQF